MNGLNTFLDLNQIDEDLLFEAVHLDIRETILKEICKKMKKDTQFFCQVKKIYFSTKDIEATQTIIQNVCHCALSEEDLLWMTQCIKSFFQKGDTRRVIGSDEKKKILRKQNYRCAICKEPINEKNVHIDHIIPWDYVGDNLEDNLQGLCGTCNREKSNHVAVALSNMILHLEE